MQRSKATVAGSATGVLDLVLGKIDPNFTNDVTVLVRDDAEIGLAEVEGPCLQLLQFEFYLDPPEGHRMEGGQSSTAQRPWTKPLSVPERCIVLSGE